MTASRTITVPAAIALAAVAVGAFGSEATAAPDATSARSATVKVAHSRLGKILVDSRGRTLYLLNSDSARKSTCFGACAQAWPPLRASGRATVGSGLKASKVGTIRRSDGKPQVTYNRHPLYRFAGDSKSGDTNGQGITAFGGRWFVLSPAGTQVSVRSSSGGGAGY
jgi:predicted lipoprotein with Yx(FWY)xxD motif